MIGKENRLETGSDSFLSDILSSLEVDFHHAAHVVELCSSADVLEVKLCERSVFTDELDIIEISGRADRLCVERPCAPYSR